MLKKFLFFLAWVGSFLISILGLIYIIFPDYLIEFKFEDFRVKATLISVCIIYIIISLLKFFSLFKKEKGFVIDGEFGQVNISLESIKGVIREILSYDKEIRNIKINFDKKGRKHHIIVYLDMVTEGSIAEKSTYLQKQIKNELQDKLELDIEIIEIKIKRISLKKKEN